MQFQFGVASEDYVCLYPAELFQSVLRPDQQANPARSVTPHLDDGTLVAATNPQQGAEGVHKQCLRPRPEVQRPRGSASHTPAHARVPRTRLVYIVLPAEPPFAKASRWAGRLGPLLPVEVAAEAHPAPLTAAADPAAGCCPPSLGPAAQQQHSRCHRALDLTSMRHMQNPKHAQAERMIGRAMAGKRTSALTRAWSSLEGRPAMRAPYSFRKLARPACLPRSTSPRALTSCFIISCCAVIPSKQSCGDGWFDASTCQVPLNARADSDTANKLEPCKLLNTCGTTWFTQSSARSDAG
jgi:hypothetical protein